MQRLFIICALGCAFAQNVSFPPGCNGPTFPNEQVCLAKNWDLGANAVDPCAPSGPYPIAGEQVYIQDPLNFCINLPNPDSPHLQQLYYSKGLWPTIVQAEGYVRSYCTGQYMSPGALPLPDGAIRSAHVIKSSKNGKQYYEISGTLDCIRLKVNCTSSSPGAYDDGGQYDSVSYRNCGKEPYSGVDSSKHPNFKDYVEQAGNGLFCMRVCQAGQQLTDPCNVKNDTAGCEATMGVKFRDGFTMTDGSNTQTFTVNLPPLASPTNGATNGDGSSKNNSKSSSALTTIPAWFFLFSMLFV